MNLILLELCLRLCIQEAKKNISLTGYLQEKKKIRKKEA